MPLLGNDYPEPSREMKKVALARIEGEALDWMRDHGDTFPELRDLCHAIGVQVDKERMRL